MAPEAVSRIPMNKTTKILLATALLLVTLAAVILYFSSSVFLQMFIAFALAYMLNPAVIFLEQKGVGRIPAILIVFTAALVICAGAIVFFAVSLGREFSSMQINLPAYIQYLYEIIPEPVKSFLGIETPDKLAQRLNEVIAQVRSVAPAMARPVLHFLRAAFSSTVTFVLALLGYLLIPVYLFYLLADLPRLKGFIQSFIPERYRSAYNGKLGEIDGVLVGFIRGQLLVCVILAVLYSIGLYFIGIDLSIAIGTLAGIAYIIPYVGAIIGVLLSALMALLKFRDVLHPLLCVGWICVVQSLESTVITPKVMGGVTGLHPLVAIMAILISGQMFGIMGMLLAVPVTAVLQVLLRSLASWYRDSDFYRGGV